MQRSLLLERRPAGYGPHGHGEITSLPLLIANQTRFPGLAPKALAIHGGMRTVSSPRGFCRSVTVGISVRE